MKFKDYLNEKVIQPNINFLDKLGEVLEKSLTLKTTDEAEWILKFQKDIRKLGWELFKIKIILTWDFSSKSKIRSKFIIYGKWNKSREIEIFLHYDNIRKLLTNKDKQDINNFVIDFKKVVENEIIHVEQTWRNNNEPYPYLEKKYGYGGEAYTHFRYEQMAHANTVIRDLKNKGFSNEKIIKIIKEPTSYKKNLPASFIMFYNSLRKNYPNEWHKFIRYLTDYINGDGNEI